MHFEEQEGMLVEEAMRQPCDLEKVKETWDSTRYLSNVKYFSASWAQNKARGQIPKGSDAKLGKVTPTLGTKHFRLREEFTLPIPEHPTSCQFHVTSLSHSDHLHGVWRMPFRTKAGLLSFNGIPTPSAGRRASFSHFIGISLVKFWGPAQPAWFLWTIFPWFILVWWV